MDNDLKSTEALKAYARKVLWRHNVTNISLLKMFDEIIDNAPTVEIPENKVNCVLTMFGKCSYNETGCSDCEIKDKIRKALNERPHGGWKFSQGTTTQGSLKCSFCNYRDYHKTNSNFCPNCGAIMKGKDHEG